MDHKNSELEKLNSEKSNTKKLTLDEVFLDEDCRGIANDKRLILCSIQINERPLKGIAGALDWKLRGFLSRFVEQGKITGSRDEFIYLPIRRKTTFRHVLVVGMGDEDDSQNANNVLEKTALKAQKLGFNHICLSAEHFFYTAKSKALKNLHVEFLE